MTVITYGRTLFHAILPEETKLTTYQAGTIMKDIDTLQQFSKNEAPIVLSQQAEPHSDLCNLPNLNGGWAYFSPNNFPGALSGMSKREVEHMKQ